MNVVMEMLGVEYRHVEAPVDELSSFCLTTSHVFLLLLLPPPLLSDSPHLPPSVLILLIVRVSSYPNCGP